MGELYRFSIYCVIRKLITISGIIERPPSLKIFLESADFVPLDKTKEYATEFRMKISDKQSF